MPKMIPAKPIKNCLVCPYISHSGAFTEGGAWPVCHGPGLDANWGNIEYGHNTPLEKPILPVTNRKDRMPTGEIPDWCPLPDDTTQPSGEDYAN